MFVIALRASLGYPETYVYDCFGNLLYAVDGSCNVLAGDNKYDSYEYVNYDYNEIEDILNVVI